MKRNNIKPTKWSSNIHGYVWITKNERKQIESRNHEWLIEETPSYVQYLASSMQKRPLPS